MNVAKQYKIGEFSKHLGVTPEFLKHYEQYGLIPPSISESGYRYYPFEMASEVLECIKLRNWKFSLKEIQKIIKEYNVEQILDLYSEKAEEMKEMISFYESLISDYELMHNWIKKNVTPNDWTIENIESFVFLPHSNQLDFIHDPNMYSIMKQWVQWMPMVHSCQYIPNINTHPSPEFQWGFCIPLHLAQKHHLTYDKPCHIIPQQRCLIIPLIRHTTMTPEAQTSCTEIVKQTLKKYNLEAKGELYREVFQYSHEDGKHTQHCRLIVPIK